MTKKTLLSILEPFIVSYFITIQSCIQSSCLLGLKMVKIWKYNQKTKLRLLSQIYTMYILKHRLKSENKTDNSDFTKFSMKFGPQQDVQE